MRQTLPGALEKLKQEKDGDANKAQLDKYRTVLGLLTLKVKALRFRDVKEAGEDEDESADPNDLEMVDLADLDKDETDEQEEEQQQEEVASTSTPPQAPPVKPEQTPPVKVAPAKGSFVQLQQARLAWDASRKKAANEVKVLQANILKTFQGDQDLPAAIETAKDLLTRFEKVDHRLLKKLDAALTAEGRPARNSSRKRKNSSTNTRR